MNMRIHRTLCSLILLGFILTPARLSAQSEFGMFKTGHQGEMFISWGWNRSAYSNSDIHFKGNNYDFILQNVKGVDRQSPFSADLYLNPSTISIPQTQFKIGYFISDKYNISFTVDHMKYIMSQGQTVKINGIIDLEESPYNGTYNGEEIELEEEFLMFEHTDGLNYVNIGVARHEDLWEAEKLKMILAVNGGFAIGMLYPKTNTTLLSMERYDQFHVAGYGLDLHAGLNLNFFKYVFLQFDVKGGFINMPDIRTTRSKDDKASQNFFFTETVFSFGAVFPLTKAKPTE